MLGGQEIALPPRCASYDGYNLHANVHFAAMDRDGLERLCRYFLRPPLALSRIERLTGADGRTVVRIGMKRMYSDGTHAIELTPQGLAEKLAALIPHPRVNPIIYRLTRPGATRLERAEQRLTWAELLQRVFRVDGWECPHCREQMSLRTVVIGMPACTRILTGLEKATGPPGEG